MSVINSGEWIYNNFANTGHHLRNTFGHEAMVSEPREMHFLTMKMRNCRRKTNKLELMGSKDWLRENLNRKPPKNKENQWFAIEHGHRKSVDFPINSMVDLSIT